MTIDQEFLRLLKNIFSKANLAYFLENKSDKSMIPDLLQKCQTRKNSHSEQASSVVVDILKEVWDYLSRKGPVSKFVEERQFKK